MGQIKSDALDNARALLESDSTIGEDAYRRLFALIVDASTSATKGTSFTDIVDSKSFEGFADLVESAYLYDGADNDASFHFGACWAIARILRDADRKMQHEHNLQFAVVAAKKHYGILREIEQNPGATNGYLVEHVGKSKSNLSQILARLESKNLVAVSVQGRFRHYYLTLLAESALREIEKREGNDALATMPHEVYGNEAYHDGFRWDWPEGLVLRYVKKYGMGRTGRLELNGLFDSIELNDRSAKRGKKNEVDWYLKGDDNRLFSNVVDLDVSVYA